MHVKKLGITRARARNAAKQSIGMMFCARFRTSQYAVERVDNETCFDVFLRDPVTLLHGLAKSPDMLSARGSFDTQARAPAATFETGSVAHESDAAPAPAASAAASAATAASEGGAAPAAGHGGAGQGSGHGDAGSERVYDGLQSGQRYAECQQQVRDRVRSLKAQGAAAWLDVDLDKVEVLGMTWFTDDTALTLGSRSECPIVIQLHWAPLSVMRRKSAKRILGYVKVPELRATRNGNAASLFARSLRGFVVCAVHRLMRAWIRVALQRGGVRFVGADGKRHVVVPCVLAVLGDNKELDCICGSVQSARCRMCGSDRGVAGPDGINMVLQPPRTVAAVRGGLAEISSGRLSVDAFKRQLGLHASARADVEVNAILESADVFNNQDKSGAHLLFRAIELDMCAGAAAAAAALDDTDVFAFGGAGADADAAAADAREVVPRGDAGGKPRAHGVGKRAAAKALVRIVGASVGGGGGGGSGGGGLTEARASALLAGAVGGATLARAFDVFLKLDLDGERITCLAAAAAEGAREPSRPTMCVTESGDLLLPLAVLRFRGAAAVPAATAASASAIVVVCLAADRDARAHELAERKLYRGEPLAGFALVDLAETLRQAAPPRFRILPAASLSALASFALFPERAGDMRKVLFPVGQQAFQSWTGVPFKPLRGAVGALSSADDNVDEREVAAATSAPSLSDDSD